MWVQRAGVLTHHDPLSAPVSPGQSSQNAAQADDKCLPPSLGPAAPSSRSHPSLHRRVHPTAPAAPTADPAE